MVISLRSSPGTGEGAPRWLRYCCVVVVFGATLLAGHVGGHLLWMRWERNRICREAEARTREEKAIAFLEDRFVQHVTISKYGTMGDGDVQDNDVTTDDGSWLGRWFPQWREPDLEGRVDFVHLMGDGTIDQRMESFASICVPYFVDD